MGKTVTAYFAFSDEHRAAVREELQAAAGTEQRISVAEVAKGLGQKWQALDDAEKERYKGIAKERTKAAADAAAAAAAEAQEQATAAAAERAERGGSLGAGSDEEAAAIHEGSAEPDGGAADGAAGANGAANSAKPAALPVSIVKRIMCIDEEVHRTSAGAVRAVAGAAELWLAKAAERALGVAVKAKRKTLKFSDIQAVAAKDKRLVEMGLQAIYDHEDTFAEARGEGDEVDENGDARPAKKQKKADTPDAKARSITSFFKAGGTTD